MGVTSMNLASVLRSHQGTGKTGEDAPLIAAGLGVWMYDDVGGLGTICPLHNFKFDRVTFLQGSITFS